MSADKWVDVTVNFGTLPPTCPSEIDVSAAADKGVRWIADRAGYSFAGVIIYEPDGSVASTTGSDKEFYNIKTGTMENAAGATVGYMTTKDKNSDKHNHTYIVSYNDSDGNGGTFDPGIKNQD